MKALHSVVTVAQRAALHAFAGRHGRRWKSCLRQAWESGIYLGLGCLTDEQALLQQLRNSAGFGPRGLVRYVVRATIAQPLPQCARAMGCLCAAHARDLDAESCNASEHPATPTAEPGR